MADPSDGPNTPIGTSEGPSYGFMPERVKELIEAKHRKPKDFLAKGFKRGWINRRQKPDEPKASDAVKLALWLEAPVEYFFDAAPEYDDMEPWEVATRSSLDFFLKRDSEGRQATQFRQLFEEQIAEYREKAPWDVSLWRVALGLVVRTRRDQAEEIRRLNQSVGHSGDASSDPTLGS